MTNLSSFLNNYQFCPLCFTSLSIEAREEYEVLNNEIECQYFPDKKKLFLTFPKTMGVASCLICINEDTQELEFLEDHSYRQHISLILQKTCYYCQKNDEQFIYSLRLENIKNQIWCKSFVNSVSLNDKNYTYWLDVHYATNCFYIGEFSKNTKPTLFTYSPNLTFEEIVIPDRKKNHYQTQSDKVDGMKNEAEYGRNDPAIQNNLNFLLFWHFYMNRDIFKLAEEFNQEAKKTIWAGALKPNQLFIWEGQILLNFAHPKHSIVEGDPMLEIEAFDQNKESTIFIVPSATQVKLPSEAEIEAFDNTFTTENQDHDTWIE